MVVACVALVLAMGGTTWAVSSLPGNSVGNKQIKNNAVTGVKVKNGSLTGSDIKRDSIGGTQIKESRLGKVPSAAKTDDFTHLRSAHVPAAASQADAPKVDLGSRGPFHFYGKCFNDGTKTSAGIYVEVSAGVTAVFGTEGDDSSNEPAHPSATPPTLATGYLTSSSAEGDREVQTASANANTVNSNGNDEDFRASDGHTVLTGVIGAALIKNGTPAEGNGPFGAGNSCIIGGGAVFG
jgi:hypothetical protein